MSRQIDRFNTVLKHVWTEPKFRAQVEYFHDYPSPVQQMLGQIPRHVLEDFAAGEGWPDDVAEQEVSFVEQPQMPDFDWWEPRHDQPWRREQARARELDRLLGR